MNLGNRKELRGFAAQRVEQAPQQKAIVLIYCALVLGTSLAVTLINFLLGLVIDRSTGLGNMGLRGTLSTFQTLLPLLQSLFVMAVDLGYLAAMLRVARGQTATPRTLGLGFDRFWPLLRLTLLKGGLFLGIGIVTVYLASAIFLATPLANNAIEILLPFVAGGGATDPTSLVTSGVYAQLVVAMTPVFFIWGGLFLVIALPVSFQYRMAEYVLIDAPRLGALAAMRASRTMLRRRKFQLFLLDLSFWWFYGGILLASAVCYADQLLPVLGISLPVSANAAFFLCYGLYMAAQFCLYYFCRNRVETAYALAYDAIRPRPEPQNGVVLGNIFQM